MLYNTNYDNTARFILGELGEKTLVVFGVNPSTATDKTFDPTIRRITGYGHAHGFDGWLMLNLYPQRCPDPKGLHQEVDLPMHTENMRQIEQVLEGMRDFLLCAAWGNSITERPYLFTCLECINTSLGDRVWHSIGEPTKEGHPRHPLYVQTTTPLNAFPIEEYLKIIK